MNRKQVTAPFEQKAVADDGSMVFEGYAAVFDVVDRDGDVIVPGAFERDIPRFLESGLIADQHNWEKPIGKVLDMREDQRGLWVQGQLVDTTAGTDMYKLMRAGVVKGLSIGYSEVGSERVTGEDALRYLDRSPALTESEKRHIAQSGGVRVLKEVQLFDVSPVSVPMNPVAKVLAVKGVQSADLPLAERDHAWDSDAALARVRRWAGAEDEPNERYARAFFWVDESAPELFGSYKLPYADVIADELRAVPRAIFAVAAVLQGARGGVDIPEADVAELKRVISRWYERMAREFDDDSIVAPWETRKQRTPDEEPPRDMMSAIVELSRRIDEAARTLGELASQLTDAASQFTAANIGAEDISDVGGEEKSWTVPAEVVDAILAVRRLQI